MNARLLVGTAVLALPLALAGCPKQNNKPLTVSQARQALDEASVAAQAEALTSNEVEITTNFTIGDAVQTAAQNLRDFITSQLPCAAITLNNATLSIQYGANPGNCTYRGQTFSGKTSVTIVRNDSGDVEVKHHWDGFSNGKVSVTGDATVTWSLTDKTRHVVHTVTWTRVSDGLTATGSGDRTQKPLSGGITEGFQVDGSRSWNGPSGQWDLAIDGVQMRWVDPVPQAGSYTLGTPFNKSLGLSFSRVDSNTIEVTVTNGNRSFHFKVTEAGSVSQSG